jgi:hypothetical protein
MGPLALQLIHLSSAKKPVDRKYLLGPVLYVLLLNLLQKVVYFLTTKLDFLKLKKSTFQTE